LKGDSNPADIPPEIVRSEYGHDVLKVALFVLMVPLVRLGLPLGMPMAGTSTCPDDDVVPV
jgi:hypothetical protein